MMASIILYAFDDSPPCRAVVSILKALKLDFDTIIVNVMNGEQFKEEFLQINPQHSIPTLNDNGFIIWDSHAIAGYLVDKYGKSDSLYPKNLEQRTLVNQRLHFDSSIIFPRLRQIFFPLVILKKLEVPKENIDSVKQSYGFLDKFLKNSDWLAGDQVTIADLCVVANISTLKVLIPIDKEANPNLTAWIKRCKTLPYYQKLTMLAKSTLVVLRKMMKVIENDT